MTRYSAATIPTEVGDFTMLVYRVAGSGAEHMAFVAGSLPGLCKTLPSTGDIEECQAGTGTERSVSEDAVLVRVHSECFTGEVLGSLRCDCREQLWQALEMIHREGRGVVVYLRQEGRGIGLGEKLRAYCLQDEGVDTVDANTMLGFPADMREYDLAGHILRDLGVSRVRLHTNNPEKIQGLEEAGIQVVEQVSRGVKVNRHNQAYLEAKRSRMGHTLSACGKNEAPSTPTKGAESTPTAASNGRTNGRKVGAPCSCRSNGRRNGKSGPCIGTPPTGSPASSGWPAPPRERH